MNNLCINIGAVIPTFNRKDSLRKILTCLQEQRAGVRGITSIPGTPSVTIAPIVVVDGSTDGTLELLSAEFPSAAIVRGDGNWWYTRSINEGIKKARELNCNYILTLNDDLTFDPDYINTIVADHLAAGPDSVIGSVSLSATTPRLITFSGVSKVTRTLKEYNYLPKFSPVDEDNLSGIRPSIVLSGRGILYPIAVFDRFGLYDERLVQYSSETDFTYTASCSGIPVMISYNARVYENVRQTSAGAVYNNPSLGSLLRSFRNKYSINSWYKTRYYAVKHRGAITGFLIALMRMAGVLKNFAVVKLKPKR
ncbi:MAG TPA: glycosyltransferase [Puia sp.]|jgi:GT2 family glycosyltransferase|nr:glycosyltransferase [Puia sp.]